MSEFLAQTINQLPTILIMLGVLGYVIRFIHVEFKVVQTKFEAIDRRFDAVDKRFEAVDRRFDAIDERLDRMEAKDDKLAERVAETREDLKTHTGRFSMLESFITENTHLKTPPRKAAASGKAAPSAKTPSPPRGTPP